MNFRYILRYCIDPRRDVALRIPELIRFCKEARIDEVMIFFGAEELSTGFPDEGEARSYIDLARKVKVALTGEGIDLSINPWYTLYCVPRGRVLSSDLPFRRMVGENGSVSPIVACPLCESWQDYLCNAYATMAAEVEPVAIWVEDDWRLHNHGGDLEWGGCFCEEHLRRFAEGGAAVTREELLEAVLRPGPAHPWRERWLSLSRDSLLEPMSKLVRAIRDASPGTRVGLMSSLPDQHSVEGRDWQKMEALLCDGDERFLLRPHMRPYTEEWMVRNPPSILRQTVACTPRAEIYPEIENSPRSGVYSKSAAATLFQMLESAAVGSPGITLNHYDMLGNGILLDPKLGSHLARVKPTLEHLHRLDLASLPEQGVRVLFSSEIAAHLQLPEAQKQESASAMALQNPSGGASDTAASGMGSLVHPSLTWGNTCAILGIPHRYTRTIEPGSDPILVNGQTLRCFSERDLEILLSGTVMLDAEAAHYLLEMGYGADLGLSGARWRELSDTAFSYEEICDLPLPGLSLPRMSAQRCSNRMLAMQPAGATVHTVIHRADATPLWPGCCSYQNARGGTVITLGYPLDGKAQYYMGFFNPFRQLLLKQLIARELNVTADALRCYQYGHPSGSLLIVSNPTSDAQETIDLLPPCGSESRWSILNDAGEWTPVETRARGNDILQLLCPIGSLQTRVLLSHR